MAQSVLPEFTADRPEHLYEVNFGLFERVRVIHWHSDKHATLSIKSPITERFQTSDIHDVREWGFRKTVEEAAEVSLEEMRTALEEAKKELQDMQDSVDAMVLGMPADLKGYKLSLKAVP